MFKLNDICLTDYHPFTTRRKIIVQLTVPKPGYHFNITPMCFTDSNRQRITTFGVNNRNLSAISLYDPDFIADIKDTREIHPNFKKFLRDLLTKEFGEIPEESLSEVSLEDTIRDASAEGMSNEDFLSIEKPKVRSYSGLAPDVLKEDGFIRQIRRTLTGRIPEGPELQKLPLR